MPIVNGIRHATASWPGVSGVVSMVAEISHGISPGRITLNILPQDSKVPLFGDLVFDAGDGVITLKDCKVSKWRRLSSNGFIDQLVILDRRWKWLDLGQIAAAYNQIDPHAKLIPYTIMSPKEIATACLDAMKEENYVINLPDGLEKSEGLNFATLNPPWIGIRHTAGTNCPVNWEAGTIPPAIALARFCESYGRRVIYQWKHDRVAIDIPGVGAELPKSGVSIASYSPQLADPVIPRGIAVAGSPTRFQMRLKLIAVGEEWDGSYRPIDQLSYAPLATSEPSKQIIRISFLSPQPGDIYQVFIGNAGLDPLKCVRFQYTATTTSGATVATQLQAFIAADPNVAGLVEATTDGLSLILTGAVNAVPFGYAARLSNPGADRGLGVEIGIRQIAKAGTVDWSTISLDFSDVRGTDRLTYEDARELARRSVFRAYRIDDSNVDGSGKKIEVPEYGSIFRRQQLCLLSTRVEQVKPEARDLRLRNSAGQPMTVDIYNGYSRDKPAIVYGVAALEAIFNSFKYSDLSNLDPTRANTNPGSPLYVPIRIDPVEQIVWFSSFMYKTTVGQRFPADLVLETSVHVRDEDTNALECFAKSRDLPAGRQDTNYLIRKYPDVQHEVVGNYEVIGGVNRLLGFTVPADEDADERADHYLDGMQIQFIRQKAETIEYNGLLPLEMDGAIQQVSWHFDGSGATTVASRNSEHSLFVPQFRDRIRDEFLEPIPFDPRLLGPLNDADIMRGPSKRT